MRRYTLQNINLLKSIFYSAHIENSRLKMSDFYEMLDKMEDQSDKDKETILSPRQEELFNLIKDHPLIPFNSIQRRFMGVPGRTLRYDLKKLADKNLIIKTAKTRGAYYKIK